MADYWKSNAKKYCDFCKCWIADNKPSIDFHEKGKRHKENVALRLKTISRKSVKEHKEKLKLDEDLKKMEKAALEAYMKDVQRNADYTSQQLNKQLGIDPSEGSSSASVDEDEACKMKTTVEVKADDKVKVWYEAISDEGYTYYWNTETGESVWEAPAGGYVSQEDQKKMEEREKQKEAKRKIAEVKQKEENEKLKAEEQRAFLEREKMRKRAKVEEPEPKPTFMYGPAPRGNPYGSWTTVKKSAPKIVDLQLPEQKCVEVKVPVLDINEPIMKFKEKNVGSVESEGSNDGNFKKRKLNLSSKRNMRQRIDDD